MSTTHFQVNDHPLHQAIYDLCQQIEHCGASTELTKAVTMANGLQDGVATLREEVERIRETLHPKLREAQHALTTAEARCKELEADKARLDWLEETVTTYGRDLGFHWDHEDGYWLSKFNRGTCGGIPLDRTAKPLKSVRAAIDAARKGPAT